MILAFQVLLSEKLIIGKLIFNSHTQLTTVVTNEVLFRALSMQNALHTNQTQFRYSDGRLDLFRTTIFPHFFCYGAEISDSPLTLGPLLTLLNLQTLGHFS